MKQIMPFRDESLLIGAPFRSTMSNFYIPTKPTKPPKRQNMFNSSRLSDASTTDCSSSDSDSSDNENTPKTDPRRSQEKEELPSQMPAFNQKSSYQDSLQFIEDMIIIQQNSVSKEKQLQTKHAEKDITSSDYQMSREMFNPGYHNYPSHYISDVDEHRGACGTILCTIYRYVFCI